MAILPGKGGAAMCKNLVNILRGNYTNLGNAKLLRFVQYSLLFPDYAGRFVFIGDDGQADLDAAQEMLALQSHQVAGSRTETTPDVPIIAFIAIHAVRNSAGVFNVPEQDRIKKVQELRDKFPRVADAPGAARNDLPLHRFFYYEDVKDLARQLRKAGWLDLAQQDAITMARDETRRRNDYGVTPVEFGEMTPLELSSVSTKGGPSDAGIARDVIVEEPPSSPQRNDPAQLGAFDASGIAAEQPSPSKSTQILEPLLEEDAVGGVRGQNSSGSTAPRPPIQLSSGASSCSRCFCCLNLIRRR